MSPTGHRNQNLKPALSGLKKSEVVMKPMPDARENRRLVEIQNDRAHRLPPGKEQSTRRQKASELESSAHSKDWRDANLYPPK